MSEMSELPTVREFWDAQRPGFDDDVDHGLRDPRPARPGVPG